MILKGENEYRAQIMLDAKIAAEQRSVAHIFLLVNECRFERIMAQCVKFAQGCLIVRMPRFEFSQSAPRTGMDANVYFTINRDVKVFCHFPGRIVKTYDDMKEYAYLFIHLPKNISSGKGRNSLRVVIEPDQRKFFTVWRGEITPVYQKLMPKLSWRDLREDGCVVADLSANGMSVSVPIGNDKKINVNDQILLCAKLNKKETYSLGTVMRRAEKKESVVFGCKFYAWCKPMQSGKNTWFRISAREGVSAIAEWIALTHRPVKAQE